MLNNLRFWGCLLVTILFVLVCGSVLAQDNQTLDQSGAVLLPPPAIKYAVASPRACLLGPAVVDPEHRRRPKGAAENFPRGDGEIKVPVGVRVVFCLSRGLEGVWYAHSFGRLRWSMVLQMYKPLPHGVNAVADPCDPCDPCDAWVTIGRDAAGDLRRGPSIGRAKVGVPVLFRRPGVYMLRAIVCTTAQPLYLNPIDPLILPPKAKDRDIVYIKVKVVNLPIIEIVPDEEPPLDPDAVHILPMPKEIDPDDPNQLSADLNGDEAVNLADFVIMAQQWGKELEIPYTDDE